MEIGIRDWIEDYRIEATNQQKFYTEIDIDERTMATASLSWRIRLAEFLLPYRFILLLFLCIKSIPGMIPDISTPEPTIACEIPDVCYFGYTTTEIFNWYEFIGEKGRTMYLMVVGFDIWILMPAYSSVLFLELYLALPDHLSDTVVSCFPLLMTTFDLLETNTHGYAVLMTMLDMRSMLPPTFWLTVVPIVTQMKFAVGGLSITAIVLLRILKLLGVWAKPKEQ